MVILPYLICAGRTNPRNTPNTVHSFTSDNCLGSWSDEATDGEAAHAVQQLSCTAGLSQPSSDTHIPHTAPLSTRYFFKIGISYPVAVRTLLLFITKRLSPAQNTRAPDRLLHIATFRRA